jgi:alginate O-acetyltransferase complex protein AlgI
MLFNSSVFVFAFLPITLIGFFLIGSQGWRRAAMAWLVLASMFFYGWFRWQYLLLFAILVLFNYYYGVKLAHERRRGRANRASLAVGLAVNLLVLAYFKYANFFITNTNWAFGSHFSLLNIVLPLGISFFTFQKIAYLVDAYRGDAEEYSLLDFSLFVMYFPQLIAGPIVHHKEMIPQFRRPAILRPSAADLATGLTLFTIGLVKKIIIADTVVGWSDPVFAAARAGSVLPLAEAWTGAIAFSFQIYFDFSGYTDMALGLALMIGIRLPLNFNSPYKATGIIDFWRRWHMTLSRFLRDYVYFPLGGNRRGKPRRYVNLMATMLLGGLWHGAAWTFVAWGGLHGLYLIVNHAWRALRGRRPEDAGVVEVWAARIVTFLAVVVAWVFFRAEGFHAAFRMVRGMIGMNGITTPGQAPSHLAELLILLVMVWLLPNSQELLSRFRPTISIVAAGRLPAPLLHLGMRAGLLSDDGSLALGALAGVAVGFVMFGALLYQTLRSTVLLPFIYFQF